MPGMVAMTDDMKHPLFLRKFGVPFWALELVFGRNHMFWYRAELSLGRFSLVGSTVRKVEIPQNLLADEHHSKNGGEKRFVATTVAEGCVLGASVATSVSVPARKWASIPEPGEPFWKVTIPVGDRVRRSQMAD